MPNDREPIKKTGSSTTKGKPDDSTVAAGLQAVTAAAMASNWLHRGRDKVGEKRISPNEITSLTALIAFVSHSTQINEFRVERELADRFNVPNMKVLPASLYDDAIRYLVKRVPTDKD